jgi:uncharacterized membrane protein
MRLYAIDILRGLVMCFMVVDHLREFQTADPNSVITDPMNLAVIPGAVYFWRIIAHFCAPVFTLLMGWSATLSHATPRKLFTRGLIMIVLEFTLINWSWTFNPLWPRYFFQIIGAMGFAMLALAAAMRLPARAIAALGLAIVFGHNLLDSFHFSSPLWAFLHEKRLLTLSPGFELRTTYPVLPIIGVALCGYAIALLKPPLDKLGFGSIALFLALRLTGIYGDPNPWDGSLLSFLNVTKYPLSLQFILMTLGPALLFLHYARHLRLPVLEQYGRTAMFFYITHIVLIHLGYLLAGGRLDARGFGWVPPGVGYPAWATAPLALLVLLILYPLCRWYEPRRLRYL